MITKAQIQHNLSLHKYYPLGQLQAMWALADSLYGQLNERHEDRLYDLMKAIEDLDNEIRNDRFPLPTKGKR